MSHPMWVRGLKLYCALSGGNKDKVAPHVGAWIETMSGSPDPEGKSESHPMWVRGLKLEELGEGGRVDLSHPMWVRGLKPVIANGKGYVVGRTPCGCVD